jgi:hypothetical protein
MIEIYYQPEKFGLTPVGEIEWGSGSYSFDLTVVWRREDGSLVYGEDSGCSCPGIFQGQGIDDLTPVTPAELQAHLAEREASQLEWDGSRAAEIADLMLKVSA